jgi:bifunctional non-homologous end joining protein LigD
MSLTEYRRKREFTRTREPEPGNPLPKGKRPTFVVHCIRPIPTMGMLS